MSNKKGYKPYSIFERLPHQAFPKNSFVYLNDKNQDGLKFVQNACNQVLDQAPQIRKHNVYMIPRRCGHRRFQERLMPGHQRRANRKANQRKRLIQKVHTFCKVMMFKHGKYLPIMKRKF